MMRPPCPRWVPWDHTFCRDEDHEGDFVPTTRMGADGTSLSSKAADSQGRDDRIGGISILRTTSPAAPHLRRSDQVRAVRGSPASCAARC